MRKVALFGGLAVLALALLAGGAWWLRTGMLDMPLSARIDDTAADIKLPREHPVPPVPPEQRSDPPPTKVQQPPPLPDAAPSEAQKPLVERNSAEASPDLFKPAAPPRRDQAIAEQMRRGDGLSDEMASLHGNESSNPFDSLVAARPEPATGEQRRMAERKQALENLPKGKIVLDAPSSMKVGENRGVHANVGINVPVEVLRRYVRPGDQAAESVLSVSSEMAATLTGSAFKITATTPERQGVAEGRPTVWSWDIEARDAGEQELEATLYVLLPGGDEKSLQRIDSFTHKIGVTVKEQTWSDWLKARKEEIEAVQTIILAIAGAASAVFGWLGWSYARRRRNENRGATT